MLVIKWVVVTPENIPQSDFVFIALTPREYEKLSQNQAELRRWIEEAMWRLEYYNNGP